MIISRTPFRISFAGGGTDFSDFYKQEGGAVLSVTIDKYIYLSMHPLFNNNGYHLKYYNNEIISSLKEIKHPIIKEVFTRYDIYGVDFNSSSDVPSGTGLGSSSSFTVGLINLCSEYNNIKKPVKDIAEEACHVEIDVLKSPIGKQDQYAASLGGINFIEFLSDGSVNSERIKLIYPKLEQLENSLIIFYLGNVRESSSILAEQKNNVNKNILILRKIKKLSYDLKNELQNNSINNLGKILHEGWVYKKELSSNVTNKSIDMWYNKAIELGAEGGKVLGAGDGGFLLLYAPKVKDILRTNIKLYELSFKFDFSGTKIIYE